MLCLAIKFLALVLRRFYPKTSVAAAPDGSPVHFHTISDMYKWADLFLDRLAVCFGVDMVAGRLATWKWNLSTCFSGVGCAESARPSTP